LSGRGHDEKRHRRALFHVRATRDSLERGKLGKDSLRRSAPAHVRMPAHQGRAVGTIRPPVRVRGQHESKHPRDGWNETCDGSHETCDDSHETCDDSHETCDASRETYDASNEGELPTFVEIVTLRERGR
jgi:hypothetical protein